MFTFEFEGIWYEVQAESMVAGGDVVELPDGRCLDIICLESDPPQVKSITLVDGPSDVSDPSGRGHGHTGVSWIARLAQ